MPTLPTTGQHKMCHTPGPWTVYKCQFADLDTKGQAACGLNGLSFDASYDECHHVLPIEDAHLMAAAPELLAALERFAIVGGDTVNPATLFQMTGADVLAARAAIRAATGG